MPEQAEPDRTAPQPLTDLSQRLFEVLEEIGLLLTSEAGLQPVLHRIAESIRQLAAADGVVIQFYDDTRRSMRVAAVATDVPMGRETLLGFREQVARGGLFDSLRARREPLVMPDIESSAASESMKAFARHFGMCAAVIVPLAVRNRAIGFLDLTYAVLPDFAALDLRPYRLLGDQLAIALTNARLYDEVRQSEARYRDLFENANDAVYVHDLDGRFLEANAAALAVFGLDPATLTQTSVRELISAADWEQARTRISERLDEGGRATHTVEVRRRDGTSVPIEANTRLIYEGETPVAIQGIARDLTERRVFETELVRTEKLRALGQMASGVAHDFNNLLAVIIGTAELLLESKDLSDRQRTAFKTVHQAALDGAHIVRRIQEFTRVRRDQPFVPVDLNAVAREAVAWTRPRWKHEAERAGIRIAVELTPEPVPKVAGNPAELREVLTNLILNAVDAMPRGGSIAITTATSGGWVELAVVDTGEGMSEDVRTRLFDPYFTTKGGAHSGLGLALTYGIISRHNGTITVDSECGVGSRFRLSFPPAPPEAPAPPARPESAATSTLRVLVVDDDPISCEILASMLRADGHTVRTCTSGEQALLAQAVEPADLVLTDLGMPEMNGWELGDRLRAAARPPLLGLVSGWTGSVEQEQARAHGVEWLLAKPYRLTEVREVMRAVALRVAAS